MTIRHVAWNAKHRPTFSDTIAPGATISMGPQIYERSGNRHDTAKIPRVLERLTGTVNYAVNILIALMHVTTVQHVSAATPSFPNDSAIARPIAHKIFNYRPNLHQTHLLPVESVKCGSHDDCFNSLIYWQ